MKNFVTALESPPTPGPQTPCGPAFFRRGPEAAGFRHGAIRAGLRAPFRRTVIKACGFYFSGFYCGGSRRPPFKTIADAGVSAARRAASSLSRLALR